MGISERGKATEEIFQTSMLWSIPTGTIQNNDNTDKCHHKSG